MGGQLYRRAEQKAFLPVPLRSRDPSCDASLSRYSTYLQGDLRLVRLSVGLVSERVFLVRPELARLPQLHTEQEHNDVGVLELEEDKLP